MTGPEGYVSGNIDFGPRQNSPELNEDDERAPFADDLREGGAFSTMVLGLSDKEFEYFDRDVLNPNNISPLITTSEYLSAEQITDLKAKLEAFKKHIESGENKDREAVGAEMEAILHKADK